MFHASGTGSLVVSERLSWNTKNPLSVSAHSDVSSTAIELTTCGALPGGTAALFSAVHPRLCAADTATRPAIPRMETAIFAVLLCQAGLRRNRRTAWGRNHVMRNAVELLAWSM
ncbi:MAG: hypothetical protein F4029_14655 [Gammaproteobacteria bacterium]|nr:hypothetical protein [Gammaproteobacteria bacterium]